MDKTIEELGYSEESEVSRSEAARILGVAGNTLKKIPIPFRQYRPGGRAMYRVVDLIEHRDNSYQVGGTSKVA